MGQGGTGGPVNTGSFAGAGVTARPPVLDTRVLTPRTGESDTYSLSPSQDTGTFLCFYSPLLLLSSKWVTCHYKTKLLTSKP